MSDVVGGREKGREERDVLTLTTKKDEVGTPEALEAQTARVCLKWVYPRTFAQKHVFLTFCAKIKFVLSEINFLASFFNSCIKK